MTNKTETITIGLNQKTGLFSSIFSKFKFEKPTEIASLRQLLSNEKARVIHTIKKDNPDSIYRLARILKRDFKAVRCDIKLLEQFGIVELIVSRKNGRERLKPIINTDQIIITINL